MFYLYILCSTVLVVAINANVVKSRQHYDSFCNPTKPNRLNVHIISHTHLDAGWVKTYDQYYQNSVYDIIETVTESLTNKNGSESRKFTFVEMSFFSRYWNDISHEKREIIRGLVTSGKLQFTSGGWVMNDEATPHYSMIIDQMSYGIRWINKTFGPQYLPTTGWQIDPFGHSREFASILTQIGFNGLFLGRIDYQDKEKRMSERNMEFIWKTNSNLKFNDYMFTGITPAGYYPSKDVCLNCYHESNGKNLLKAVKKQIEGYRTKHIMETMGGDFNYDSAEFSFKSTDQMIQYVNSIQNEIYLLYSTPNCYIKAVYESGVNWTDIKSDDFFPYADRFNDFWTGYFTSRPAFKYLMNYANNILQISKQLIVKANIHSKGRHLIKDLEEAVAICQHHDAISGTSKQYVSDDYVHMISHGLAASERLITLAYRTLHKTNSEPHICHRLNISECQFLDKMNGNPIEIAIYNPLAHRLTHFVRLPLIDYNFQIFDSNRLIVESQIIPIPNFIQSLAERDSSAKYELVFEVLLEPIAFTKYYLQYNRRIQYMPRLTTRPYNSPIDLVISNDRMGLIFDGTTGLLIAMEKDRKIIRLEQNFAYYTRGTGKNSGAYAMHTDGRIPNLISKTATVSVIKGSNCEEVIQEFSPYLKQIIRIYKNSHFVEFDWIVGPLPDDKDFELISRFHTGIRNDGTFYTDSNGKQTVERRRDCRPTWSLSTSEEVSSNYYPVISWLYIRDITEDLQLTLVPDRAQGGSSIEDGSVELMIHRRLHRDDGYGMEERLNEPGVDNNGLVVRGKHYLLIDRIGKSMKKVKDLNTKLVWNPLLLFLTKQSETQREFNNRGIGVTDRLDPSIHLLTLEELEPNLLFTRFEYFTESESSDENVSFVLNKIFTGIQVLEAIETSLTGAETLSDMMSRKYKWICDECDHKWSQSSDRSTKMNITLTRDQIRSFILKIKRL